MPSLAAWTLIIVYDPIRDHARTNFVVWFYSLDFAVDDQFLIIGYFKV